jgi:hypothetical protein
MIKELLKVMFKEHSTLRETAERLGVDSVELKGRIDMLLHMGYIKKVAVPAGECGGGCSSCLLHANCDSGDDENSNGAERHGDGPDTQENTGKQVWGYELTAKGKRLVEK